MGRLVMAGDTIEFAIFHDDSDQKLLFAKSDIRPYFTAQSLGILLEGCAKVVFTYGKPMNSHSADYLREAQALCASKIKIVRYEDVFIGPAMVQPIFDAIAAAWDQLPHSGTWHGSNNQPQDFPLLPARFPSCYEGKISAYGVDGKQIRADIALHPQ